MKKILNSPANYVDEMLAGLVAAHPEYYRLLVTMEKWWPEPRQA